MSLRGGEWFFERREQIKELIEGSNDEELTVFLKNEKDRMCQKCTHWGNDVGHYDSGNMATCYHPKLSGNHHPSNGCGTHEQTLVYCPVTSIHGQLIQTRWNFGCLLWERKDDSSN